MSKKKPIDVTHSLDNLLRSRYQGASNIAGIRFQLLYSLLRTFDLYADVPASHVQFEGLEDVDVAGVKEQVLKGLSVGDTYVQVKLTGTSETLSWLDHKEVLDHFIEVYLEHRDVRFVVVTSLPVKSNLEDLARYCHGQQASLSPSADRKVREIAARTHLDVADIPAFLHRVSFEHMSEDELLDRLRAAIVRSFDLNAGNELLYLSHLMGCATLWAANRTVLQKQHLDTEKIHVQEWISLGAENPAVRDRLMQPLSLVKEERVDDYYEGKQTRPGHILAELDAPRLKWQRAIEEALERVRVCAIRASSGQGKSTLLYRYAVDHFAPDTIYSLNVCSSEEQVGPLVDYLRNRLQLGLPLLVLIDNLSHKTRLWHEVATKLAGEPVRFLMTTREEDWYRYGFGASGFAREFVEPHLSLQEAKLIYSDFYHKGKIAPNIPSAGWAYEQVAEKQLLIEFVYLITHGRMLVERIEEQVRTIEARGEDRAKLEVLRLVATAQLYGTRVSIMSLLQHVGFERDPDATLKSLEREYIMCEDGECEGLHFVRSEHLVRMLHTVVPVQHTVTRLLKVLDTTNLVALVASTFADSRLQGNELLPTLVERCREVPLSLANTIIEALFLASETLYIQANKQIFDRAVALVGAESLLLLTALTLPNGRVESLYSLAQQYPDRPKLQILIQLAQQMHSREEAGLRHMSRVFLEDLLKTFSLDETVSLADVGQIGDWCYFFNASVPALSEFLIAARWEAILFHCDAESTALLLHGLSQLLPNRYSQFVTDHRSALLRRFQWESKTLTIEEKGRDINITFIVDERQGAASPNDQAVQRLHLLRRWFQFYETYHSQGFYPSTGGEKPKVDDSHKSMTGETLDLGIHASKNSLYRQLVEKHYASKMAYDWEKPWDMLRRAALKLVRLIISQYEKVYQGYTFNRQQITVLALELDNLQKKILPLPNRLKSQFTSHERIMNGWTSHLLNFWRQFVQHDPRDPQQQDSRLMRHNLKEATKRLSDVHQAFAALFMVEIDHFAMTALNSQEREAYSYLADLLDYWFVNDKPCTEHLEVVINRWREERHQAFVSGIREGLAPLAEQGMQFLYPIGSAYNHPLTGLYLGYEVIDFRKRVEQVALIIGAVATIDVEYTFLYLVPTLRKHQFDGTAVRLLRETVKQVAAREASTDAVFPVPLPEDIYAVLPDLDLTPLTDVTLVLDFARIAAFFIAERNKLSFASSALDIQVEEEKQLFYYYNTEVETRMKQLLDTWIQLQEKVGMEDSGTASREWQHLWTEAAAMVEQLANIDNISTSEIRPLHVGLSSIEIVIAEYLNRKYLSDERSQRN